MKRCSQPKACISSLPTTRCRRSPRIAADVNERMENIGARRLHTILERLLDEVSFAAPEMHGQEVAIDAAYVRERLAPILKNEDLSRYIL